MEFKDKQEHKAKIKEGSMGHLTEYIKSLLDESQERYNSTKEDHRYHQSRVNTLNEIFSLLPEASK